MMTHRKLFYCPSVGCSQTSGRRWNMQIHIKRKHNDRYVELTSRIQHPNDKQPSFSPNQKKLHINNTFTHPHPIEDEIKQTETSLDKFVKEIRRLNEFSRSINEFTRNSAADSGINEIARNFQIQMVCNLFQNRRSVPAKKMKLTTGYRISFCDTCVPGCSLKGVFYPIEFEAAIKTEHECDSKDLFDGQNEEQIVEKPRQVKVLLEDYLLKSVSIRLGQKDAYLKAMKLSKHWFSEGRRRNFKIPANKSLIEEKDCIKTNFSYDKDHWFYRTISTWGKNSTVKLTQNELTEFLKIASSTFGVFGISTSDPADKSYFLIYLVL